MKYIKLAIAAGIILISSCAQSIPETTNFNGKAMTMHLKATTGAAWEFYINGELVIHHKIKAFEGMPVMNGTWRGKPVMIKMQMVSSGWTTMKTADVFIDGQLVETLVVS
jgi:hypothetical protein